MISCFRNSMCMKFAQKQMRFVQKGVNQSSGVPNKGNRLIFDKEGFADLFEHLNGNRKLAFFTRGFALLSGMSIYLFLSEHSEPLLGPNAKYFFLGGSVMGLFGLTVLNVYAKRVVQKVQISKTGQKVQLTFFNAFWKPKSLIFPVSEFNDLRPSYGEFYKFEAVSQGNYWICLNSNLYQIDQYEASLVNVLDGKSQEIEDSDKKKALKILKKQEDASKIKTGKQLQQLINSLL